MRPITIVDLQESSEDYKRYFPDRKIEFMAKTEANEKEFLEQELDAWGRINYDLHLMKIDENDPWFHLDMEELNILSEAIRIEGFNKMYYSAKRKLEFLESLKTSKNNDIDVKPELPDLVAKIDESKIVIDTKKIESKAIRKSKPSKPKYFLRSICIAIHCLGWNADSPQARKLLKKYFGNDSPPGLKNNIIIRTSEITSIEENPNKDKWRKIYLNQANRLLHAEKNQKAIETIIQLQKVFQVNLDNYNNTFTG